MSTTLFAAELRQAIALAERTAKRCDRTMPRHAADLREEANQLRAKLAAL